jgi:hypothetical protein
MRWNSSIWFFLLGAFGGPFAFVLPARIVLSPAITFAYDGHNQSKSGYDSRRLSAKSILRRHISIQIRSPQA